MVLDSLPSLKENFIYTIRLILEDIEQFNEDEIFYKTCYDLRSDKKALMDYLFLFGSDEMESRQLISPVKQAISRITECDLFGMSEKRNVLLRKHSRFTPPFEHFHNYFEVFYVLSGQCINMIEGGRFVMPKGSLCFIAPYVSHTIEVFDNSIILNICIRKTTFDEIFINLLTAHDALSEFFIGNLYSLHPVKYMNFEIGANIELIEIIFSMLIQQSRNDEYSDRIMNDLASIFFATVVRENGGKKYFSDGIAGRLQYIEYINDNFRTVSLSDVAKHFGVSAAHCSRLIKSITGKNFVRLVRDIRLRHAQTLLVSSTTRIADISYSLGYENQETFIRNFKKAFGVSPGQYRSGGKA